MNNSPRADRCHTDSLNEEKKQSKYTLVKTLSIGVCLCKDVHGNLVIAKYAKNNDKTILKEIALTELLSTGSHINICDPAKPTLIKNIQSHESKPTTVKSLKIDLSKIKKEEPLDQQLPFIIPPNTQLTKSKKEKFCEYETRTQEYYQQHGAKLSRSKTLHYLDNNILDNCLDHNSESPKKIRKQEWTFKKITDKIFTTLCSCFVCSKCSDCFGSSYTGTSSEETINSIGHDKRDINEIKKETKEETLSTDKNRLNPYIENVTFAAGGSAEKQLIKYKIIDSVFDHSCFCEYVNITLSPQKSYLITKYSGVDLYELTIYKKRLHESLAKVLTKKLVNALRGMHSLGICHGDMSLENVCADHNTNNDPTKLDSFQEIKEKITTQILTSSHPDDIVVRLIDYGYSLIHPYSPYHSMIASYETKSRVISCEQHKKDYMVNEFTNKIDDINTYTTSLITKLKPYDNRHNIYGKEHYISPERYMAHFNKDLSYCSYKDDVYSIGVMIFTMITGMFPYTLSRSESELTSDLYEQLKQQQSDAYEYIQNLIFLSPEVFDIINMILKPEIIRPSLDQILDHPWLKGS